MIFIFTIFVTLVLNYDRVYGGVYIKGESFENLTLEEVKEKLENTVFSESKEAKIILKSEDKTMEFDLSEIGLDYDEEIIAEKIYNVGRDGNLLTRVTNLIDLQVDKGDYSYIEYEYDEELLDKKIDEFYETTYVEPEQYSITINEETKMVAINSGKPGSALDKEKLKEEIIESVISGQGNEIEITKEELSQDSINLDTIYKEIKKNSKDATIALSGIKDFSYVDEENGIEVDKTELAKVIEEIDLKSSETAELPITLVEADLSVSELEGKLFKDTLSTYKTTFNAGNYSRSTNIRLASAAINGVIIMPGEEFSYNGVVGQRTAAKGYQEAPVYANGEVTTGIGGGICQVSTTIHNAVIRQADMELITRRNHMFAVNYVPYGYDATVSYGSQDYVFKNASNYPIKVMVSVNGGTLTSSIIGTKENDKTVALSTSGSGLTFNTYRTVKDGDEVVSTGLYYSSSYSEHP
jgi:vancomycin resistance protein YoaR